MEPQSFPSEVNTQFLGPADVENSVVVLALFNIPPLLRLIITHYLSNGGIFGKSKDTLELSLATQWV